MLTIVSAATATSLTTLARARAMLDFAPEQDAVVSTLIEQASRAIVDHCRRPFALETVREVFRLPDDEVMLTRSPVVSFVEVKSGDMILEPEEYQHYAELNLLWPHSSDGGCWDWSAAPLTVTYTAGFVLPSDAEGAEAQTLPPSVERAAIRLVGLYLSHVARDPLIKSETIEGVGSTSYWVPGAGSAFGDPEIEQLLTPWRRLF